MDIKKFKAKAIVEPFNSNNGWGFGGSMGKAYKLMGLEIREGKYCYRYAPSESFVKHYNSDGYEVNKKKFEELISYIE